MKKIVIVGDIMLNNINSRGLSKANKLVVLNFPGATSADIIKKIDHALIENPQLFMSVKMTLQKI